MKKQLYTLTLMLAVAIGAQATIITVSNNGNSPGQYTNLQDAIDAASPNDTLYVHGSPTSYGDITIDKPLTLIGNGWKPDKQFLWPTEIDEIILTDYDHPTDSTVASGSAFVGIYVSNLIRVDGLEENTWDIEGIAIDRCKITALARSTTDNFSDAYSWILTHSVIGHFSPGIYDNDLTDANNFSWSGFVANNCIFYSSLSSVVGSTFRNCIFRYVNEFGLFSALAGQNQGNLIENSIIHGYKMGISTPNISYNGGTIVNNCIITEESEIVFGPGQFYQPTGTDNLIDVDPLFVSDATAGFEDENDYHLQSGSPAINAGSDGTDIGITGGTNPWPSTTGIPFQNSPLPSMPQIIEMELVSPFVPSNGTIDVRLNARKQD